MNAYVLEPAMFANLDSVYRLKPHGAYQAARDERLGSRESVITTSRAAFAAVSDRPWLASS